jgi:uncharacterized protein (DUF58 family)
MASDPVDRSFLDAGVLSRLARLTVTAQLPMLGSVTGLHRSATRGSSVEFAEYRKYVPGDDIKHLDWRVFARTDRFYMKEFEADTNLRCYVVLDASGSMAFAAGHGLRLDYARRIAATLAHLLVEQGDGVGLLCFNERAAKDIPPRRSPAHLKIIYDTLAAAEARGFSDLSEQLHGLAERVRPRALVVIVSDLLTDVPPLMNALQHLRFRKHDVAVFHLVDPQEMSFDFDRPIRFLDLESSFDLIADPALVRDGYTQALRQHLDAVQVGCRELSVDYHLALTDASYENVLAQFLLQRIGRRKGARR